MKETYYLNLNLIASERNTNDIKPEYGCSPGLMGI